MKNKSLHHDIGLRTYDVFPDDITVLLMKDASHLPRCCYLVVFSSGLKPSLFKKKNKTNNTS